jgi:hypothetical protein
MDAVVTELLKKLRPEKSPLIVARDFLIGKGVPPPIVTDEWWLYLVEVTEAQLRFPDLNLGRRWIFPLPFPEVDCGTERGLNIAWAALQMDWASDGEERNICQLTHPERVHEFLRKWPGLFECSRANPGVLAMYGPQVTIPGFDDGLADVFDKLMDPTRDDAYQSPGYGGHPETMDGKEPHCGELIAWRHPTFGNYTDKELAYSSVEAHDSHYSRNLFNSFECPAWLLSNDASWMPQRLRDTLLEGMRDRTYGWSNDIMRSTNAISDALLHPRSKFKLTRAVRSSIIDLFAAALQKLCVHEDPIRIAERFLARGFVDGFYDEQDRIRLARKG